MSKIIKRLRKVVRKHRLTPTVTVDDDKFTPFTQRLTSHTNLIENLIGRIRTLEGAKP